jgi:hypothetical protein
VPKTEFECRAKDDAKASSGSSEAAHYVAAQSQQYSSYHQSMSETHSMAMANFEGSFGGATAASAQRPASEGNAGVAKAKSSSAAITGAQAGSKRVAAGTSNYYYGT